MKVWSKACPKCRGDLKEEVAIFDTYIYCTNCRYTLTHKERTALTAKAAPSVGASPGQRQ